MWIRIYLIEKWTSILKMVKEDVFHMKPKLQYHLSQWEEYVYAANEENVFMLPNLEKKEDYYVNPCLSKSTNEH